MAGLPGRAGKDFLGPDEVDFPTLATGDLEGHHGIGHPCPGVRVHELSRVTASLEAAYLALTGDDVEYRAAVP